MSVIDTTKIDFWEPHPGSRMRVIGNGEHVTLVYARLKPGSDVPEHKHPSEQMGVCLQGEAIFIIDEKEFTVKEGFSWIIPENTTHSMKISEKEEFVSVELFSPPRPDLLRREFAPDKLSG